MTAQVLATLLGMWLMAAPAVLGYGAPAATHDHIAGPLIASFAMIAVSEVTRNVRWVNAVAALWLLVVPWLLGYEPAATWNSIAVGAALGLLSAVRGRIEAQYGGGWAALWRSPERPV